MNKELSDLIKTVKALDDFVAVINEVQPTTEDIDILMDLSPGLCDLISDLQKWTTNSNIDPGDDEEYKCLEPAVESLIETSDEVIGNEIDLSPLFQPVDDSIALDIDSSDSTNDVVEHNEISESKQSSVSVLKKRGTPTPLVYIESFAWWIAENCNNMKMNEARKIAQNTFLPYLSYQTINCALRQASHKKIVSKYYSIDKNRVIKSKNKVKPSNYVEFWYSPKKQPETLEEFFEEIVEKHSDKIYDKSKITNIKVLGKANFVKDMPIDTYVKWANKIYEAGGTLSNDVMNTSKPIEYTKEELLEIMHVEIDLRRACILGAPTTPVPDYLVIIMICEGVLKFGKRKTNKLISYIKKNYGINPNPQQLFQVINGSYGKRISELFINFA